MGDCTVYEFRARGFADDLVTAIAIHIPSHKVLPSPTPSKDSQRDHLDRFEDLLDLQCLFDDDDETPRPPLRRTKSEPTYATTSVLRKSYSSWDRRQSAPPCTMSTHQPTAATPKTKEHPPVDIPLPPRTPAANADGSTTPTTNEHGGKTSRTKKRKCIIL